MTDHGTVVLEVTTEGCHLRVELALGGSHMHLYEPVKALVEQILYPPDSEADFIPAPIPAAPEPPVVGDIPAESSRDFRKFEPAHRPSMQLVDEKVASPHPGGPNGVQDDVLACLLAAGGEIRDPTGRVTSLIAEKTGRPASAITPAIARLKRQGLAYSLTAGKRTKSVTLTKAGREAAGEVRHRQPINGSQVVTFTVDPEPEVEVQPPTPVPVFTNRLIAVVDEAPPLPADDRAVRQQRLRDRAADAAYETGLR